MDARGCVCWWWQLEQPNMLIHPTRSLPPIQALIPYYTGQVIDYASIDPSPHEFKITTLKVGPRSGVVASVQAAACRP